MTDHPPDPVPAAVQDSIEESLAFAREGSLLRDTAARLDDALVAEVPELGADEALRADLDASTLSLLEEVFGALARDASSTIPTPDSALQLARTIALRRQDIGVLLRAYRIGQRLAWSTFVEILGDRISDPALRFEVLTYLFERVSRQVERTVEESIAVFTDERDRWLSGALARKADLIQALLRGDHVDVDEATRVLGHRLSRHHLGLVLWLEDPASDTESQRRLAAAAQAAGQLLGCPPPLTIPDGARSLHAWLNVTPEQDLDALDPIATSDPGLLVAIGLQAYGVAGFRASHRQAVLASRVALSSAEPLRVTPYDDVSLVSAFLADPEETRALVARELGGLANDDEATGRLRETALSYLRQGGNARDAAAAIHVHKNTVLYRIPRIEQRLGHPIGDRRLQLEMALELVERLGAATMLPG